MAKAFNPKPYGLGSTVELEGRTFSVQAPGPKVGTVWALEPVTGYWVVLRRPTAKRIALIVQDRRGVHGEPLA